MEINSELKQKPGSKRLVPKKSFFRYVHIYVSVFFLPLMIMYLFTGLLYICDKSFQCGINYNSGSIEKEYILDKTVENKEDLIPVLKEFAEKNNIRYPKYAKERDRGGLTKWVFTPSYNIEIKTDKGVTKVKTTERRWWGVMSLMHFDKAGKFFSWMAILFSANVMIVYLSGFIFTAWCKNHRTQSFISLGLGASALAIAYCIAAYGFDYADFW